MANNQIQATGTFMTRKGLLLITKLAGAKGTLHFTRSAVGTGKLPDGYSPEYMADLSAYKMDANISEYGVQEDKAYITVQISSAQVEQGFLITEVGVYAEDPDEGEILYGYMDISTDPTYIYANGSTSRLKFAEFTMYVLIGSVERVTAAIPPGSIITRDSFKAENLKVIDSEGILGEAGGSSTGQLLLDALAQKVKQELMTSEMFLEQIAACVLKEKIVNHFLATDPETVLSGPMGKQLKDEITQLNSDFEGLSNKRPWKLISSGKLSTGADISNLPDDYNEICVETHRNAVITSGDAYLYIIPRIVLNGVSGTKAFYPSAVSSIANNTGLHDIMVNLSSRLITGTMYSGGSNISSSSGVWIYYR